MLGVKLVVYDPGLDPGSVSARLGLEPTESFRRGDPIVTKGRRHSDHPTGGWVLSSRDLVASGNLEDHVIWLLDRVEPAAGRIRELQEAGSDVAVICVLSGEPTGGGPTLGPRTIARLAALELPVDFDLYC